MILLRLDNKVAKIYAWLTSLSLKSVSQACPSSLSLKSVSSLSLKLSLKPVSQAFLSSLGSRLGSSLSLRSVSRLSLNPGYQACFASLDVQPVSQARTQSCLSGLFLKPVSQACLSKLSLKSISNLSLMLVSHACPSSNRPVCSSLTIYHATMSPTDGTAGLLISTWIQSPPTFL